MYKYTFSEQEIKNIKNKKITGSRFGKLLGIDPFSSPEIEALYMAKVLTVDIDPKYLEAGNFLEPLIIESYNKKNNCKIKTFKGSYDEFPNQPVFGGVPDGLIEEEKILIEIKTTMIKNKKYWVDNQIPEDKKTQTNLYAELLGYSKVIFLVLFLEEEDYKNLKSLKLSEMTKAGSTYILNESDLEEIKKQKIIASENLNKILKQGYVEIDNDWKGSRAIAKIKELKIT